LLLERGEPTLLQLRPGDRRRRLATRKLRIAPGEIRLCHRVVDAIALSTGALSTAALAGRPAADAGIVTVSRYWPCRRRVGCVGVAPATTAICEPLRVAVWVMPWLVTCMALP
jgi:hypothetical protein